MHRLRTVTLLNVSAVAGHHAMSAALLLVMFLSPYLMQGFETCNTVQTCVGHMYKGNRILIQVIIGKLSPHE